MAESFAMQRLNELEKELGKGPTFTRTERDLVLKHGVPAWVILGSKLAKGEVAERCSKAIKALEKLHADTLPVLPAIVRPSFE